MLNLKKQYVFNGESFSSKKKVDDYIRNVKNEILYNKINKIYPTNQYYDFFIELINNHISKNEKMCKGIDYFYFIKDYHNKDQLRIQYKDNTNIDCSYMYSKITKTHNSNEYLNSALRHSIHNQIQEYKSTLRLPHKCNICNELLSYYEIDHIIPFNNIKQDFLQNNIPPTEFYDDIGNTCKRIFRNEDEEFSIKWQSYHKQYATYQVLCLKCNRKKWKY